MLLVFRTIPCLSIRPGTSDATTAEIGLWVEIATATSTGASRGTGTWCSCGGTDAGGGFTTDQKRYGTKRKANGDAGAGGGVTTDKKRYTIPTRNEKRDGDTDPVGGFTTDQKGYDANRKQNRTYLHTT